MSIRKYKAEQILTLLRQIEVQIANGKTTSTPRPMTAGGRSTADKAGGPKGLLRGL